MVRARIKRLANINFMEYTKVKLVTQTTGQIGFITEDGKMIKNLIVKEFEQDEHKITKVIIEAMLLPPMEKAKNW